MLRRVHLLKHTVMLLNVEDDVGAPDLVTVASQETKAPQFFFLFVLMFFFFKLPFARMAKWLWPHRNICSHMLRMIRPPYGYG